MSCIFCQIVSRETPVQVVYEDDQVVAFKDIHPKAPVHLLIIPKKHITSLAELSVSDKALAGHILWVVKQLAEQQNIASRGYKVIFNTGPNAGQVVTHLHAHLLGGGVLSSIT